MPVEPRPYLSFAIHISSRLPTPGNLNTGEPLPQLYSLRPPTRAYMVSFWGWEWEGGHGRFNGNGKWGGDLVYLFAFVYTNLWPVLSSSLVSLCQQQNLLHGRSDFFFPLFFLGFGVHGEPAVRESPSSGSKWKTWFRTCGHSIGGSGGDIGSGMGGYGNIMGGYRGVVRRFWYIYVICMNISNYVDPFSSS